MNRGQTSQSFDDSFVYLRNQERKEEIRNFLSVCSGHLALPLFLAFWIADIIYAPDLKWEFLALRFVMVPVCLLTNRLIKTTDSLYTIQKIGLGFVCCNSLSITTMIVLSGNAASPYYAGLNLVGFGVTTFVPWTRTFLYLSVLLTYIPFYLVSFLLLGKNPQWAGFAVNSFFVSATIVISLVVRHFTETLRRKEILSRTQLHNEIISREEIIKTKTEEAVNLSTLAKQFSPQVVQSISTGRLSLNTSLHSSLICAIFIDIVDSTDNIRRLNLLDTNAVISMFMEDTMMVLLKYDITIDKFLGDGVLAFSNDPVQRTDFTERVIEAAFEIRNRIASRQSDYIKHWNKTFQIRIGIAQGEASVGFYGSSNYFKSYTAIGRVVNLASRLCSSAEKNQISISLEVAEKAVALGYETVELINQSFKGFEGEKVRSFQLVSKKNSSAPLSEVATCPLGHGVLHLDTNDKGIYLLQCRVCNYIQEDLEMDKGYKKAG